MLKDMNSEILFCEYYRQWVDVYKKGTIRETTLSKYLMTQKWGEKLAPELKLCEPSRTACKRHWDMRRQIWKSGGRLPRKKGVS